MATIKSVAMVGSLLLFVLTASAADQNTLQTSLLEAGRYSTALHPFGGPLSVTQNLDPMTVTAGSSVACTNGDRTTDNGWWRVYDLDGDHGVSGEFCVESVDFAIEAATGGPQPLSLIVGCTQQDVQYDLFIDLDLLDIVGGGATSIPEVTLQVPLNVDGTGCCDADTEDLVIGLESSDCKVLGCGVLFLGGNDLGQTAPPYISAQDCGIPDPLSFFIIGYPKAHIIQVVNASVVGDPVPATNGLGIALVLLALSGSSLYLVRRRTIDAGDQT